MIYSENMKFTVAFFQICALYGVLFVCSPALAAPFITVKVDESLKNSTDVNKELLTYFMTLKPYLAKIGKPYNYEHEQWSTFEKNTEENVSTMTSGTSSVIGINDDETPNNYANYNWSKSKGSKYEQLKSVLEAFVHAGVKIKASSMEEEKSIKGELTTNKFDDFFTTEMPTTIILHSVDYTTERLYNSPKSASTRLHITSYPGYLMASVSSVNTTTTLSPYTTTSHPTTLTPTPSTITTSYPTTTTTLSPYTTTSHPTTTTTLSPYTTTSHPTTLTPTPSTITTSYPTTTTTLSPYTTTSHPTTTTTLSPYTTTSHPTTLPPTPSTTTQLPITTNMPVSEKSNKVFCTLCIIIAVND
uniref:Uncharacterized protein n=1 Tax=Schizaphis graminum TaxID=13262 RepID=A0A2S2PD22_SCHGA